MTSQEAVALVADQTVEAKRIHPAAPVSSPRAKEKQSEAEGASAVLVEGVPTLGTPEFGALCKELDRRSLGYRAFKRVFDFVFALLVIVVGFIPGVLLSIAIAIDTKGSPIYSQERIGKRGKPFRIYKFRSMVKDSDNVEKYFTPEQLETWKRERKVEDDPRITKLGGFLRHTSMASVIIGTPGAGEPTNSLSSAAKTSLDQQFYDRRPEVVSCDAIHYNSPEFLSFTFFGGSGKAQNAFAARTTGVDQSDSRWHGGAFHSMNKNGACGSSPALGVAA